MKYLKLTFLAGHKKVGTLMNYDPIPTTSKQAAMAMTLANAGKRKVMDAATDGTNATDSTDATDGTDATDATDSTDATEVTEVSDVTEDTIESPPSSKKLKIEEVADFDTKLTQGETSNVKDGHMLFLLREQQLAMERQRFLFKKQ